MPLRLEKNKLPRNSEFDKNVNQVWLVVVKKNMRLDSVNKEDGNFIQNVPGTDIY